MWDLRSTLNLNLRIHCNIRIKYVIRNEEPKAKNQKPKTKNQKSDTNVMSLVLHSVFNQCYPLSFVCHRMFIFWLNFTSAYFCFNLIVHLSTQINHATVTVVASNWYLLLLWSFHLTAQLHLFLILSFFKSILNSNFWTSFL